MNRVSRENPNPTINQYICFCFTYRYLFLAALFLQESNPVKAWWVPKQCWCNKECLSRECFLAEMESPGTCFNLEIWNKEEWPASLAAVGVVRMIWNGPVPRGWRSLWRKVLIRTWSPVMSVKVSWVHLMGLWERAICIFSHEVSNKVKDGKKSPSKGLAVGNWPKIKRHPYMNSKGLREDGARGVALM